MSRRSVLAGLLTCMAASLLARPAAAGAAIPISLQDLLNLSEYVLVGRAVESESQWEYSGTASHPGGSKPGSSGDGTKRIVTYTRLGVEETLDGQSPSDGELFVRTLGGVVGDIGQIVHGEAELQLNQSSVLFLRGRSDGTFRVTAMAQGHYPLATDDEGTLRLGLSPRLSDFVREDVHAAVGQLRGKTLPYAHELIRKARSGK